MLALLFDSVKWNTSANNNCNETETYICRRNADKPRRYTIRR